MRCGQHVNQSGRKACPKQPVVLDHPTHVATWQNCVVELSKCSHELVLRHSSVEYDSFFEKFCWIKLDEGLSSVTKPLYGHPRSFDQFSKLLQNLLAPHVAD